MRFSTLPDRRNAADPLGPCIADPSGSLSNQEFLGRVRATAQTLRTHGVGAGDVVAVMLPNRLEFVVVLFAAWRIGATVTPINPLLTVKEALHQLTDSGAKLLINGDGDSLTEQVPAFAVNGVAVNEVLTGQQDHSHPVEDAESLALLIYTSGTTGLPKGVMLDHANIEAMVGMGIKALEMTNADHSLLILPLFHVNGIVVGVLTPLASGGKVTIGSRFDPKTFFKEVERIKPTFFSAVPTIYTMLNALPAEVKPNTSSIRFAVCGAAPASAELLLSFESRFGFPLIEGYGLSEGTCGSCINPIHGVRKAGTVGLPFVGQTIAIADREGKHLPQGQVGEVLIQGANVMKGYLNRPEETAKTIVNGWLHTGDVGRVDEDGYLSIVGRWKEMIIRGGENIYPKEIEDALVEYPAVLEAAVIGASDPTFGEIVVAYVAVRPNHELTQVMLAEHCADRLTRYKRPAHIVLIEGLPKNAVGKIDKLKLKALWRETEGALK